MSKELADPTHCLFGNEKSRAWLLRIDFRFCDATMYHMAKASVRDLRYKFHEVEDLLRQGQEIQITKRKRVIGTLVPAKKKAGIELPDFDGRLRKIFGNRKLKVSGADLIARDRDRI